MNFFSRRKFYIYISNRTSVSDITMNKQLLVYPRPTKNYPTRWPDDILPKHAIDLLFSTKDLLKIRIFNFFDSSKIISNELHEGILDAAFKYMTALNTVYCHLSDSRNKEITSKLMRFEWEFYDNKRYKFTSWSFNSYTFGCLLGELITAHICYCFAAFNSCLTRNPLIGDAKVKSDMISAIRVIKYNWASFIQMWETRDETSLPFELTSSAPVFYGKLFEFRLLDIYANSLDVKNFDTADKITSEKIAKMYAKLTRLLKDINQTITARSLDRKYSAMFVDPLTTEHDYKVMFAQSYITFTFMISLLIPIHQHLLCVKILEYMKLVINSEATYGLYERRIKDFCEIKNSISNFGHTTDIPVNMSKYVENALSEYYKKYEETQKPTSDSYSIIHIDSVLASRLDKDF
jgi:hypothetical protein